MSGITLPKPAYVPPPPDVNVSAKVCPYCGGMYARDVVRCQNCGAPKQKQVRLGTSRHSR